MTTTKRPFHQPLLRSLGFIALVGALALSVFVATGAAAAADTSTQTKPTIVLVHGAWADSSSWSGVIQRLQGLGFTVLAPANPLRSLQSDSAYISSFLTQVSGPIVLVGHSYGGMVITNAANGNSNVKALVYVSGFIPDQNENAFQLVGKDSHILPPGTPWGDGEPHTPRLPTAQPHQYRAGSYRCRPVHQPCELPRYFRG
jgi:pimeloyl-ACP methyl ester carboxylesterase